MDETEWEDRVATAWESFDELDETEFLALIEKLAAERPAGDGAGFFERASSLDATDHPDVAIPLYEQALTAGLPGGRAPPGGHPAGQFAAAGRAGARRASTCSPPSSTRNRTSWMTRS